MSFSVFARAVSESTITPDQIVTQNYLYAASSNTTTPPTTTPKPAPTSSSTNNSLPPTPTPTPKQPELSGISISSISQSDTKISITTTGKSAVIVHYGFSPTALSQNIISLTPQTQTAIDFPKLQPDTTYYFTVTQADNPTKSDIFTFRTAVVSEAPTADIGTLIATSNNGIITSPNSQTTNSGAPQGNTIVVPVASSFSIQFSLAKITLIKSIQAFIVNKSVLGATTFKASKTNPNYVDLVQIQPGVYTGKLLSQPNPGNYELYTRIIDYNGNITIQKIADMNIVNKLTILEKETKKPIENARGLFYLYNPQSKTFTVISPSILPIVNPSFAVTDGTINVSLPQGKYKVEISAIGYKNQTIDFTITSQGGYPTIYLTPSSNIFSIAQYYLSTLVDSLISSQIYFQQQARSSRLFDLSTVGGTIFLIGITILSISARTHIAVLYLPYFLYFKLILLFRKDKSRILFGQVIDEKTAIPISRAKVYLSNPNGNHVLVSLITNKLGEFYYKNTKGLDYKVTVIKEGYSYPKPWEFINDRVKAIPTILKMEAQEKPHHSIIEIIVLYAEDFLGIFMEFLIILGLLTQIYFIFTFGIWKVAPFIGITIINLLLIFTFLYKPRNLSN